MTIGIRCRWASLNVPVLFLVLLLSSPWCQADDDSAERSAGHPHNESVRLWQILITQAETLGLPTKFLNAIKPGFVILEFDDLHAFAAEYHPDEHRMVLNLSLSFNMAGGALKPLSSLTPRDLSTLYHELFHAYMDYISTLPSDADPHATDLLDFAKDRQECRYRHATITPVRQRKGHTETRVLTDRESWEALNETWAVFIGWAVWTQLEAQGAGLQKRKTSEIAATRWLERLKTADRDADLVGYYEPEDADERGMARKRYLAPSHRISPKEVSVLLEQILEYPKKLARRSAEVIARKKREVVVEGTACRQQE